MNTMLVIENTGEIDVAGLRLLGATSKAGQEGKIGFFGTGTKYAIASALRLGASIVIYSGEKRIEITTRPVTFREDSYDEIMIDGHATGITTRTGIQWQAWFIVREFLCNAIDEGGDSIDLTSTHGGMAGKTRVFIELNNELREVYDNWDSFFSFDRHPYHQAMEDKVFLPTNAAHGTVYRKGVKVWESGAPSILDYDFPDLKINEARVAKSDFEVTWGIVKFWKAWASPEMLGLLFTAKPDRMEWGIDWSWGGDDGCEAWLTALRDVSIIPREQAGYFLKDTEHRHLLLPLSMCVWLHKAFGTKLRIMGVGGGKDRTIQVVPMTPRHKALLDGSISFLKQGGFTDIDAWPINVALLNDKLMGCYYEGQIYIADDTFSMGRRQVAETLLEEYAHAKSKEGDETREFQNVLLRFVINAIENKTSEYL